MLAPAIPRDEKKRLATLRGLNILDTPPEERFDRLTRLAQRIFDVPIAVITLVDSDRQWFKSCQGLDATETPRSISFCGHAILGDEVFVIPDAALDPRFADNPLVAGAPHIRFYAGQPLKANNGSRLGTLCILDIKPRQPSQADLDVLRDLAALVESELNLLDTVETQDSLLRDSEAVLSATINAALDAVVHMDSAGIITRWNNQAEKIFGWPREEAVGRMLHETIIPPQYREAHIRGMEHFLVSGEGPILNKRIEMTALHRNGHEFPIDLSITPLKMAGQYEFSAFIRDITERKLTENLEHLRIRTFELLNNEAPLPDILEEIVLWVESQNTKTKCSIMLLDDQSKRLFIGAAPNLPDCYKAAMQGILIGDENCTCSVAAHSGVRVVFENILTPCRTPNCALAAQAGIASCWSEPIKTPLGKMQGVFAVYHTNATSPGQDEIKLLELAANLAGVAIERKQTEAALRASELRLREITELMPVTLFVKDAASRFIMLNKAGESQFGVTLDELRGTDGSQFFPPEQMTHFLATDAEVFATGRAVDIDEVVWNVEQKQNRQIRTLKKPVYDETGAPLYLICMTIDITEHKQLLDALRLSSLVLENSSEGMLVTDENNLIIAVNPAFITITGYTFGEVQGKNPKIFSSSRHDSAFYEAMWQAVNSTGHWQGEIWDKRKNGEVHAKWLTINTIRHDDGSVYRYVALFSDITEKKRSEETIWKQANFDTLTGLPNRDMFHDRLEQEAMKSHRADLSLALLLIDLDQFKEVNDTLGHDVGDILLQEAAHRIRACVRESDTVARLGGDEFTIVLSQLADTSHVEDIAQKIITKMAEPYHLGNEIVYVSASIGITLYPNDATDIDALMQNADQAMYVAKNKGRNRFSHFTLALQQAAQTRLRLTHDLRGALAAQQFRVYFQPIVELSTGHIHKAEALLRWQHPERGMVSPMEFIPLAEETGLIVEIGDWIFHESARWVKRWDSQFSDNIQVSVNKSPVEFSDSPQISVNVSPVQFKVGSQIFAEEWLHHLRELGLSGKSIVIEITEGLLLNAESDILKKLLKLRDAGIQVAIDDFGTGYSSLAYLKKFDIDYLKIDQSFVRNLETDPNDMALSEAIIVMAHTLGLKVIAEGVETEGQRKLLAAAGCDYAQGYLFSKPVPPEEFEALLKSRLSVS
jgi:diguanylate cyclase (GGDEF)-like protein/PAS domain S-box-containing protein